MKRVVALLLILPCFAAAASRPTMLGRAAEVPQGLDFIRSFDVEGYVERMNDRGIGVQTIRLRTRYLDPDVNAFVGLVTGASHFNIDLRLGNPENVDTAGSMWDWGINLGLKRGRHLWELDLMGCVLSASLAPTPAIVGEHVLTEKLTFYHRTQPYFFAGDTIIDADQGIYWMWGTAGLSAGYRLFAAKHMSRSGPHIGVRLRFESPKIPFLFPSLG